MARRKEAGVRAWMTVAGSVEQLRLHCNISKGP